MTEPTKTTPEPKPAAKTTAERMRAYRQRLKVQTPLQRLLGGLTEEEAYTAEERAILERLKKAVAVAEHDARRLNARLRQRLAESHPEAVRELATKVRIEIHAY